MYWLRCARSIAIAATIFLLTNVQAAPSSQSLDARDRFPFSRQKIRGINLGGWFVLEPWITPSLFEQAGPEDKVVDEHSFCAYLGKAEARRRLERHWSTWIQQRDFQEIASRGLNLVRIPIGYWSVIPRAKDPYVPGAYEYLARALDWASAAGLKVMIDLHGAPRSQNGFDNSGRRGPIHWGKKKSVQVTERVLTKIRNDFADHPAVATIEVLNEPQGNVIPVSRLKRFYLKMNKKFSGHDIDTTFMDAFVGVNSWNDFGNSRKHWILDTHHYEVFSSDQLQMDVNGHVGSVCYFGGQMAANNKVTISGEWVGALTDCAKYLNGRGFGARYDGTLTKKNETSYYIGSCKGLSKGTVADLSSDYKNSMRQYIEASMDAFENSGTNSGGWIWWTWRTESSPEWDFQALAKAGVIPQPLTNRQYPGQCSQS